MQNRSTSHSRVRGGAVGQGHFPASFSRRPNKRKPVTSAAFLMFQYSDSLHSPTVVLVRRQVLQQLRASCSSPLGFPQNVGQPRWSSAAQLVKPTPLTSEAGRTSSLQHVHTHHAGEAGCCSPEATQPFSRDLYLIQETQLIQSLLFMSFRHTHTHTQPHSGISKGKIIR